MNQHELALQHAMKALILIQDEIVNKEMDGGDGGSIATGSPENEALRQQSKKPEDRMIVLCIAYHNIAVEQEFLKQYQASLNSYSKAAQSAQKYLGEQHPMTANLSDVLNQATNKIAALLQKNLAKN